MCTAGFSHGYRSGTVVNVVVVFVVVVVVVVKEKKKVFESKKSLRRNIIFSNPELLIF